jgi:hypothetical protein
MKMRERLIFFRSHKAKIAALEPMVGRHALEIEFLKGTLKNAPRPKSAITVRRAGGHRRGLREAFWVRHIGFVV